MAASVVQPYMFEPESDPEVGAGVGSNALQVTQMSKKVLLSDKKYFSRSFFKSVILLLLK